MLGTILYTHLLFYMFVFSLCQPFEIGTMVTPILHFTHEEETETFRKVTELVKWQSEGSNPPRLPPEYVFCTCAAQPGSSAVSTHEHMLVS